MGKPVKSAKQQSPLDVTVYLHIEPSADAFHCEIVAGTRCSGLYNDLRELQRYTLIAAKQARQRTKQVEHAAIARLAEWISSMLRDLTGAERAAVIALSRVPGSKGLHWLIAPLTEHPTESLDIPNLGMESLLLKESSVDALARRLHQALA